MLSVEDWNLEVKILKSLGLMFVIGRSPSQTPITFVTALILIEFWKTDSILAYETVDNPGLEYDTTFPTVAIPENMNEDEETVLIPPLPIVIFTWPTLIDGYCFTSPVKVEADPTTPYKDLILFG